MPNTNPLLHYSDDGKGEPLILVHGFPLDMRVWDDVVPVIAERFRIIRVDLRGFGQSTDAEPFTMKSLADDLYAFISALGLARASFAGLSMGGYVLQEYALHYPQTMARMALVDTKSAADTDEAKQNRDRMIEVAQARGAKAIAELMMPKMCAEATHSQKPQLIAKLQAIMEDCPPSTIAHALAAMRDRADYTDHLSTLQMPVELIFGEQDAITSADIAQDMASRLRNGELHLIEAAGHMAPMEEPDLVAAALSTMMRR